MSDSVILAAHLACMFLLTIALGWALFQVLATWDVIRPTVKLIDYIHAKNLFYLSYLPLRWLTWLVVSVVVAGTFFVLSQVSRCLVFFVLVRGRTTRILRDEFGRANGIRICLACGYDLRGCDFKRDLLLRCPECGEHFW